MSNAGTIHDKIDKCSSRVKLGKWTESKREIIHDMWCVYLAGVLFWHVTSKAWRRILKVIQKGPAHINNKSHEMWCVYLAGVLFRQVTSKAWRGSEFQTRSAELCPDTVNSHNVNIYTRSLCLSLKPNCEGRFFTANWINFNLWLLPSVFYGPDALPAAQPTTAKHSATQPGMWIGGVRSLSSPSPLPFNGGPGV